MIWIVCGAGSGVGKTHLSFRLCDVLPDSAYAKLGHHSPQKGKPENYFTSREEILKFIDDNADRGNLVLESNSLAKSGIADLAVFIDEIPGRTDVRDDRVELMNISDIIISASGRSGNWKNVLEKKVKDPGLINLLLEIFSDHEDYIKSGAREERQV